jgi:hypothetical protein
MRGTLSLTVDCRFVPSGDRKTDNAIIVAKIVLAKRINEVCKTIKLEALGFPGHCLDADGFPFTVKNLQDCLEDSAFTGAEDLLDLAFPTP